jgi:hypothetical protein
MKNKKRKKERQNGFFKEILIELRDSILFEVAWNILMFIPRMMIRLIRANGALAEDQSCLKGSSFFMELSGQVSIPVVR